MRLRSLRVMLSVVASLTVASLARGDVEADRAAAAALADTALERYGRGDVKGALELFTRAYGLVHAATFAVYEARCLGKLGRLAEADEAYARAEQFDDGPGATPAQQRAVADARAERVALRRKREDDARTPTPGPIGSSGSSARMSSPPIRPGTGPTPATLAALGVGAAGVAVGVTWGAFMLSRRGALDEACPQGQCPPSRKDDVDRFRSARTISTVGWGVGLLGLGVGAGLWIGGAAKPAQAGVNIIVGPTGGNAVVTF